MPLWLEIVIAVVGLLGTILGVLGISGYLAERGKFKAKRANERELAREQEEEERKQQRLTDSIRTVFREESKPINDKIENIFSEINEIKVDLAANTTGTVTMLRDRMKAILDLCREDGYASASTKANWHELYKTYRDLGGNHFLEYVNAWKEEMDDLPVTPIERQTIDAEQLRALGLTFARAAAAPQARGKKKEKELVSVGVVENKKDDEE